MKSKLLSLALLSGLAASAALGNTDQQLASANNQFGLKLLQVLHKKERNAVKNQFISPFSIHTAFGMALSGARGETRRTLLEALQLPAGISSDELNDAYASLQADAKGSKDVDGYDFKIANHFFAQEGFGFLPEYQNDLELYYGSGVTEYDFRNDAERAQAISDINQWASDNTNAKIPSIVDETSVTEDTRFVLTNAVYFLADWQLPFERNEKTGLPRMDFHSYDGSIAETSYLNDTRYVPYAAGKNYQAVELKYKGKGYDPSEYSMVLVLPNENSSVDALLSELNAAEFDKLLSSLQDTEVNVTLPAFQAEVEYKMGKTLEQSMGMQNAFSDQADFSGMNGQRNISISEVIHKTFVRVDNKGTEAAAVTATIGTKITSVGELPAFFRADRPFLYAIVHRPSNTIAFVGTLLQPAGDIK